ncbi:MAG TPA: GLUG motif-containing protein [Rhizomicrobium sp.]
MATDCNPEKDPLGVLKTRSSMIAGFVLAATVFAAPLADASVTISTAATRNMNCSGGVCSPTGKTAFLNVSTLETMLASGNATVTTGSLAKNIIVDAGVTWATSNLLTLDAYQSVTVVYPVQVTGTGSLALVTNDGGKRGTLSFVGAGGNIVFSSTSSSLGINGQAYVLVDTVAALASGIAGNPAGYYALANSYDATGDGTYAHPPIATSFTGIFEGLGNIISNLSVVDATASDTNVGFFASVDTGALVENLGLAKLNCKDQEPASIVGALAGSSLGTIRGVSVSGTVRGKTNTSIGGLVGINDGLIVNSSAAGSVNAGNKSVIWIGGLAGENEGSIIGSNATGEVGATGPLAIAGSLVGFNGGTIVTSFAAGADSGGDQSLVGGLVGANGGSIENSYATGAASGGATANIGGLIGFDVGTVATSYSAGAATGGTGSLIGGLIGNDQAVANSIAKTYWDTTSSGISNLGQGSGNISNDPGITGLTTTELQSGLPAGFTGKIWGLSSGINGGLPYLLLNQPSL